MNVAQKFVISRINRYQDKGGGKEKFRVDCNFEPSCSEYTKQAIINFGLGRGIVLAIRRVKRCTVVDQVDKIHDPLPLRTTRDV